MIKQQKIAIILLPLLAMIILFGGTTIFGSPAGEFYEGSAEGYGGEIRVRVEVLEEEIVGIEILEMNETVGLGDNAAEATIEKILESQSTEVDVVSGATMSSNAVMRAVENALGITSEEEEVEKVFAPITITLEDGEYEGVATGYYDDIKVLVEVTDGTIANIELVEINDTEGFGDTAALNTIKEILSTQSVEIDAITGATASSQGTIEAVKAALGMIAAPVTITLEDGEYEGVGTGFDGDIKVMVEVADGSIANIQLIEINDTEGLGDTAALNTIEEILSTQSVEIDAITGATISSQGTIDAVKDAVGL
ncbi:Uncharacterized protein conserved in bacteria [Natronincola peptidivorans]|uniref:Uncharacterized protein conserved in bacteria n=1 Tax=Natronincola peptidivorans TaxID=426128 RepID=A0A1I0ANN9_9FIRM|nr:FMN-binding protein [Natronincola peptidivorans]SES95025.1 Uncharacterized protein conserved in bacteria [Natronincola peptidivorans]